MCAPLRVIVSFQTTFLQSIITINRAHAVHLSLGTGPNFYFNFSKFQDHRPRLGDDEAPPHSPPLSNWNDQLSKVENGLSQKELNHNRDHNHYVIIAIITSSLHHYNCITHRHLTATSFQRPQCSHQVRGYCILFLLYRFSRFPRFSFSLLVQKLNTILFNAPLQIFSIGVGTDVNQRSCKEYTREKRSLRWRGGGW